MYRLNRWKKRGVAAVPTMYGIAFSGGSAFLNQAGALLLVYVDGSVLLAHGGVEMGQGLHTKMIQVASRGLGIPPESIHVNETSTDKVANASPTAGSFSSDLNGAAVLVSMPLLRRRDTPRAVAQPLWGGVGGFNPPSPRSKGFFFCKSQISSDTCYSTLYIFYFIFTYIVMYTPPPLKIIPSCTIVVLRFDCKNCDGN